MKRMVLGWPQAVRRAGLLCLAVLVCMFAGTLPVATAAVVKAKKERREERVLRLKELLKSQKTRVRVRCAEILGDFGDTSAAGDLLPLIEDPEDQVKGAAAYALGKLGAKDAVKPLLDLLGKATDPSLLRRVILALGDLGDPAAVDPIMKKASNLPELWVPAAQALGNLADKRGLRFVQAVLPRVEERIGQCRVSAALGKLSPRAGLGWIEKLFKDKELAVKFEALNAAGDMNNAEGAKYLQEKLLKYLSFTQWEEASPLDAVSEAIGHLRDPKLMQTLLVAAEKERNPKRGSKELSAAIRGIGRTRVKEASGLIRKYLDDSEEALQLAAVESLGLLRDEEAAERLLKLADSADLKIAAAALTSLGEVGPDPAIDLLIAKLKHEDSRIRFAAANALYQVRVKEAIEPLIDALASSHGWLQEELSTMLRNLTGKDLGLRADAWLTWWKESKDSFAIRYEEDLLESGDTITYYGIEVNTHKVVFVLDISGSMDWEAFEYEDPVETGPGGGDSPIEDDVTPKKEKPGRKKKGRTTRLIVAKRELVRTLKALKPDIYFNIMVFSSDPRLWRKEKFQDGAVQRPLFPARDQFREEAIKYVDGQSSGGGTNIHDSLERCFEMAGKGVTDPAADIDLDTIFFLTDGTPTQGKVTDPEKILEKVREWNKLGRIRVHTIGVGTEQNVDLLRRLARENGGRYVKK